MKTFGLLHLTVLVLIAAFCVVLSMLLRQGRIPARAARLAIGWGIIANELIWWAYRYGHEGLHLWNLPFQLCDVTLWASAIACLTLAPRLVEFAYFGGMAGAGMALITPDLWSPWPSYPAIYFFLAHGGIVLAVAILVFGRVCPATLWRGLARVRYAARVCGPRRHRERLQRRQFHVPLPQAESRIPARLVRPVAHLPGGRGGGGAWAVLVAVAAGAAGQNAGSTTIEFV